MNGKVYLVGAGPGDPGLITAKGLELIRRADAVVYDRLIPPELLTEMREDAQRHYVGRARGSVEMTQERVNELLVELARAGNQVVRLKGGDPFVFGRGGEEGEACAAAGVPFEVVPGISSANAVPAYAGIPLTHRVLGSSYAVLTGHEALDKAEPAINWAGLATAVDTLVILMGVAELPRIVYQLLSHGRAPETPTAVITEGTRPEQRTIVTSLGGLLTHPELAHLRAPAIVVVGDVVRLRDTLRWFD